MNQEYKHKHGGHRQRLKNKVKKSNLRTLEDHEILELLLTYTIPRKDTNPIAHDLLGTFTDLDEVIDADFKDLQKVKGVGEETALFFNVLSQLFAIYKEKKVKDNNKLTTLQNAISYFRKRFEITNDEFMLVLCLTKTGKVISNFYVYGNNDTEVKIDVKNFADKINVHNTKSVIVFHTHPNGSVDPSAEDLDATQKLYNICAVMGIELLDHIIVNNAEHFSFANNNLLEGIRENCQILMNYKGPKSKRG